MLCLIHINIKTIKFDFLKPALLNSYKYKIQIKKNIKFAFEFLLG